MVVVEGGNVLHHVKRRGELSGESVWGNMSRGDVRIPGSRLVVYSAKNLKNLFITHIHGRISDVYEFIISYSS